ncbi:App1 family protein [Leeuwenhoekiella aequorea]|uniref:Phosphatidate phosphatase APP1 n=1 Tax=Leeuwenhoekiella aequorea TaxID=283736 RepID=A0A4Q0P4H6_9FLAO|nr:phosphatase domain-containing protein [Leeuwenhoekiella aequorea]RXG21473.1 phosphatidate phosphatase APP1 [Leeuwenhoekiella aequorea]
MFKEVLQRLNLHEKDPLQIHGYQSYGTHEHIYLLGRALEDEGVNLEKTGFVNAFKNAYRQFRSDELSHAKIKVKLPDNRVLYTITDEEGYFKIDEKLANLKDLTNEEGWLQLELAYDDENQKRLVTNDNKFAAQMLIPSDKAEYGVISDIDDTMLKTGVTSLLKWRVILNTLFKGVGKRTPFTGAADFYKKLHLGKSGSASNPMFYVSNSPWNLYHYLEAFIKNNSFPKGAILLRDFRTPFDRTPKPEKPHKQHEIRNILKTYPDLQFVLIGDSGEHDADIYIEIAEEYPERIKAIYLRSVTHEKRAFRVRGLLEKFEVTPALLVKDSTAAEDHAREQGLII